MTMVILGFQFEIEKDSEFLELQSRYREEGYIIF